MNEYKETVLKEAPSKIQDAFKDNPNTITRVEVNYLRKLMEKKCAQYPCVDAVKSKKDGDWVSFELFVNYNAVDFITTALRSLDSRRPTIVLKDSVKKLLRECGDIAESLNITYSERDTMTDYHGVYRYHSFAQHEFEDGNHLYNALCRVIETLREENEKNGETGVYHERLAELLHKEGIEVESLSEAA